MGIIKKGRKHVSVLLMLLLVCALIVGCGEKGDAGNTDTSLTVDVQKKVTKAEVEESEESEIPDSLIPGQSSEDEKEEGATAGTAGTVFDASDEGIASGTNPGTNSSGSGNSSESGGSSNGSGSAGTSSSNGESEATEITVSVSVDSSAVGSPVAASGTVTLGKGSTAFDALTALVGNNLSASGGYVAGIGGLSEKDYGARSGWMYSVNGVTPNKGSTAYTLKDGDIVQWSYVTG